MTPNDRCARLRQLREERGWTQQEVSEQLARVAWLRRRERVGVNSDMIAKWERGVKAPSRRYTELLALLYGVNVVDLSARPSTTSATAHAPSNADDTLVATLGDAAALLERLGPAAAVLQPRMFDVWKDQIMRRRVLLKLIGLAPAGVMIPDQWRATQPTPEVVAGLHELADQYQSLYHSTAPSVLIAPVVAHLETLGEVLRESISPSLRRRLMSNRARVAMLVLQRHFGVS